MDPARGGPRADRGKGGGAGRRGGAHGAGKKGDAARKPKSVRGRAQHLPSACALGSQRSARACAHALSQRAGTDAGCGAGGKGACANACAQGAQQARLPGAPPRPLATAPSKRSTHDHQSGSPAGWLAAAGTHADVFVCVCARARGCARTALREVRCGEGEAPGCGVGASGCGGASANAPAWWRHGY